MSKFHQASIFIENEYDNGKTSDILGRGKQTLPRAGKESMWTKGTQDVGQKCEVQGTTGHEVETQLEFKAPVRGLVNLRMNQRHGTGQVLHDNLKPWEGNLYEVIYSN